MRYEYDGFTIETFEAGTGLWHARIMRADLKPVVIDDVSFSALEVGFAWASADAAVSDAKFQIDQLRLKRFATVGELPRGERSAA